MDSEEIQKAIKKWHLEDEQYSFKTLKGKYSTYCMICFIENRKIKVTRIINNKCETRIFNPFKRIRITLVQCKR